MVASQPAALVVSSALRFPSLVGLAAPLASQQPCTPDWEGLLGPATGLPLSIQSYAEIRALVVFDAGTGPRLYAGARTCTFGTGRPGR